MKTTKLTATTKLNELSLPFLEVILEEMFLLSSENSSLSIEELSQKTGMKLDDIKRRLSLILKEGSSLFVDLPKVKAMENPVFLNMTLVPTSRLIKPMFKPEASLFERNFKERLLELKDSSSQKVLFSEDPKRSFSAGLYLRGQGFKNLYCLKDPEIAFEP